MKRIHTTRILLARQRTVRKRAELDRDIDSVLESWFPSEQVPKKQFTGNLSPTATVKEERIQVDSKGELRQPEPINNTILMPERIVKPDVNAIQKNSDNSVGKTKAKILNQFGEITKHVYDSSTINNMETPPNMDWMDGKIFNYPNLPPEDSTAQWIKAIPSTCKNERGMSGPVTASEIMDQLQEQKAVNLTILDVSDKCTHLDHVIICEGVTERHVYALSESVRKLAKNRYEQQVFLPPTLSVEGEESQDWLMLDLGSIMVHFFTAEKRAEVDLEGVWEQTPDIST